MSNNGLEVKGALDIDALLKEIEEKTITQAESDILDALSLACTEIVNEAKAQPSPGPYPEEMKGQVPPHQPNYIDWTRNLRGSIGYVLYFNGREHKRLFSGTPEGMSAGEAAAKKAVTSGYSIVAVIVAGENYALNVESLGYNVISEQCAKLKDKFEENIKLLKG